MKNLKVSNELRETDAEWFGLLSTILSKDSFDDETLEKYLLIVEQITN